MKTFTVAQSILFALASLAMAKVSTRETELCSDDVVESATYEADWVVDPKTHNTTFSENVSCLCREDDCLTATCFAEEFHTGERLSCTQVEGGSCGFLCVYTDYNNCKTKEAGCNAFVTLPPKKGGNKKEQDDRSEM